MISIKYILDSKFFKNFRRLLLLTLLGNLLVSGCLITNCPKGGKRSERLEIAEINNVKQCIPCGPNNSGQCFGPSICCGPFGCLMGTSETIRCHREGKFNGREPCLAGTSSCRKNTGRCAIEGICCDQESCYMDKECILVEDKKLIDDKMSTMDLFNYLRYQQEMGLDT